MNSHKRRLRPVHIGLLVTTLLLGGLIATDRITPVTAAHTSPQEPAATPQVPTPEQTAFFEQNIQPILTNHCYDCHSTQTRSAGGLRLDDRDALLAGGKSGPAIVPASRMTACCFSALLLLRPRRACPKARTNRSPQKRLPT